MIRAVMSRNSPVLQKLNRRLFLICLLCAALNILPAQQAENAVQWFKSNSSGMALEPLYSRIVAFRSEYFISVRSAARREIPPLISSYYVSSYSIELRTLYERGEEIRQQWTFRDSRNIVRVIASGNGALFGTAPIQEPDDKEEERRGFIEIRNSEGAVTREIQFEKDQSELEYRYTYRDGILLRVETWLKEKDSEYAIAFTDNYRYTRSASLRAIDRTIHEGASDRLRLGFPRIGAGVSLGGENIIHGSAYTSGYFMADQDPEGSTINYNVDNRGRILGEVWKDEDGTVIGEMINTWSGDRLLSTLWKSDNDERLFEFEYDNEGQRTVERNFRKGVLERTVTKQDETEVEEIYMNGRVLLRAYWENGVKIREERVSSPGGGPPR